MPLASAPRRQAAVATDAEFTVSTSLPPMVTGAVAGEIELSVPYLYPKPGVLCATRYLGNRRCEPLFAVRMQWWGDREPGTVLKPDLLTGRDEHGVKARQARLSKATCALFPVRCGLDGLVVYLRDMGNIALDVLVHEGEPKGSRHVGRCVIPVGNWSGQLDTCPNTVVAEGYYPVISLDGNKYAGDLRVRLRVCLGPSSRLRSVLTAAKMAVDTTSTAGGETREIVNTLGQASSGTYQNGDFMASSGRQQGQSRSKVGRSPQQGAGAEWAFGGLPTRASFDSEDLSHGSTEPAPVAAENVPRGSAPLSSFQLNEALAKFDASDTLPVWPTPKSSLYRPPETHGKAPPKPLDGKASRGRLSSGNNMVGGKKVSPVGFRSIVKGARSSPTRVGVALVGSRPPERKGAGEQRTRKFVPSVSPERQAPHPNPDTKNFYAEASGPHRAPSSPLGSPGSPRLISTNPTSTNKTSDDDGMYLSELLNRGKELRDKMSLVAGNGVSEQLAEGVHEAHANAPMPPSANSFPSSGPGNRFVDLAQPGFVSEALSGYSLRDDIEGIFDTVSDNDTTVDEAGVSVRDPETRGHEDRVVNLLLAAAGPPPSSLAFPALAAVERRRAESLARVRFLRIRVSRLVMFGSMTSAPDGHGWQVRFRLPAFAALPGRSSNSRRTARHREARGGGVVSNARVVSFPVPPKVPSSSHGGKGRVIRRGRAASAAGSAGSMLRLRRGFGASDLMVGETSLLEEVVCAVDVDDACVRRWMDVAIEFMLVDGKSDGAPRRGPNQRSNQPPHLRTQQEEREKRAELSTTIGLGDRVAAVATLPLRDLLLSAELGVTATLDLTEVLDFWAVEDARNAAAGLRGRGGRPLRNPYRGDAATSTRPLVLGDRAVGALAVAFELVPGEVDVSPEHSRPEVERGFQRRPRHGEGQSDREGASNGAQRYGQRVSRSAAEAREDRTEASPHPGDAVPEVSETEVAGGAVQAQDTTGGTAREGGTMSAAEATAAPAGAPGLKGGWEASLPQATGGVEMVSVEMGCTVMLKLEDLTLAPAVGDGIGQVRVAYSFSQTEEGTPTVTHRSVPGCRGPPPPTARKLEPRSHSFAFHHEETFPAPVEGTAWRIGSSNSNRVLEVWGLREEHEGYGSGQGETLLGLAKISLGPFASFEASDAGLRADGGGLGGGALAIAADGPVLVMDPFSGRTVGELHVFLALGTSAAIAAVQAARVARGGGDAPEITRERGGDTTEGGLHRPGAAAKGGCQEEEQEEEENGKVSGGRTDWDGGVEAGDSLGGLSTPQEDPALDDSAEELSMLLNPGRAAKCNPDPVRSSGGFTGLVRHVIELSAVGELPLALDAEMIEGADEPVGCTIEYSLPSGQGSLEHEADDVNANARATAGQAHELWWDADSGILNSRARHTIKIPGGTLDKLPDTIDENATDGTGHGTEFPGDRSLNNLLDCMFGQGDVSLLLFWSASGAGLGQRAPSHRVGGDGELEDGKQERRPLGKTALRRSDLLPLVRRTSGRVVLELPIEATRGRSAALPSPDTLPLSISYRREPLAVARRKSLVGAGRRREAADEGDGRAGGKKRGHDLHDRDVSGAFEGPRGAYARGTYLTGRPLHVSSLHRVGKERPRGEASREGDRNGTFDESWSLPHGAPRTPERSVEVDDSAAGGGVGSPGSRDSKSDSCVRPSSRAEHMLPARTTVCVRIDSIDFSSGAAGMEALASPEEFVTWASFEFPEREGFGQGGGKDGVVWVWRPGRQGGAGQDVHWSPAVSARREGGRDRVPLEWSVELPVTIDSAFVEFVHTQSLEVCIWRGRQEDWPEAGTSHGVAKVALRSLLTTLGSIGGTVSVNPGREHSSPTDGSIAILLFFKHRGLRSNDASPHKDGEMAGGHTEGGRGGVEVTGNGGPVQGSHQLDGAALDEKNNVGGVGDVKSRAGAEIVPPLPPSLLSFTGFSNSAVAFDLIPGQAVGDDTSQSQAQQVRDEPTAQTREPVRRGKLRVHVERAMRLPPATSMSEVPAPGASTEALPSTYVTFRWEEGGKPPLRSPLVLEPATSGRTVHAPTEDWRGAPANDGEATTPTVESTSNPVFNHAADLRLNDANSWGRVCGPSAVLVFRVWRRSRCSWWGSSPPTVTGRPSQGSGVRAGGGQATAPGSRFGDKLIGSAVVGLEVLRGAVDSREGTGLREIDGWYHVLDDLQRPQGQIKVQVRPQPPTSASDFPPTLLSLPDGGGTGAGHSLVPASHGPWPKIKHPADREEKRENTSASAGGGASEGSDSGPDDAPPLHDTQAHLRAVHALLDSLPAEFRPTQRRPPLDRLDLSMLGEKEGLGLPSPSEEPLTDTRSGPVLTLGVDTRVSVAEGLGAAESGGGNEHSGLPELRRMLSSLTRMDQRMFALAPGGAIAEAVEGAQDDGRERGEVDDGPVVNGVAVAGGPYSDVSVADGTGSVGVDSISVVPAAVSRLQRAWRAKSRRMRETGVEARLETCAQRQTCRVEAAVKIQVAHRHARARRQARAVAEERRRWEGRQRRRVAACATVEKAWKAFETRRRAARELAEARVRVAAAATAERRAWDRFCAAALLQALWRGVLVRAAAGRLEVSRARSRVGDGRGRGRTKESEGGVLTLVQVAADVEQTAPPLADVRVAGASGVTLAPRPPLIPAAPSTFYNQLSQDPRRHLRFPDSHVAAVTALPSSMPPPPAARPDPRGVEEVKGEYAGVRSERFGPRPVALGAGVVRPPRFADLETARIARIMKGSLQQWAGVRAGGGESSSSDDYDV